MGQRRMGIDLGGTKIAAGIVNEMRKNDPVAESVPESSGRQNFIVWQKKDKSRSKKYMQRIKGKYLL